MTDACVAPDRLYIRHPGEWSAHGWNESHRLAGQDEGGAILQRGRLPHRRGGRGIWDGQRICPADSAFPAI